MNAPLVAWLAVASNSGPRGYTESALRLGPEGWAREQVRTLARSPITHACIAYPGGQEGPSDLRFDMIHQASFHEDPRVQALGDNAAWANAAQIIREAVGCKVGFYLGTSHGMETADVLEVCEHIIAQWHGYVDFIVIDTLGDRPMGHTDHIAAQRLEAAGFEVWGEPRPVRDRPLLPRPYLCFAKKWNDHGGKFGDTNHTPLSAIEAQGASIILIDGPGTMTAETVSNYRMQGIGVCVGVDRVPIVAIAGGLL